MKLKKLLLLLPVIIIGLSACEESDELTKSTSIALNGYWINRSFVDDTVYVFERASALKENDYGFAFKSGKVFIERKNSGWCGTPPIAYSDFDGTWEMKNDSVVEITVEYWGGLADYEWKIISLDDIHLTIYPLKQEYEHAQE